MPDHRWGGPHVQGGSRTSAPSLRVRTAGFREKSGWSPMQTTPTGDGGTR